MRNLYFAYGANLCKDSMRARCPNAMPISTFELRDWELVFYRHATVQPTSNALTSAIVHGALWQLTPECEHALDMFEGYPEYYTKTQWVQDGVSMFFYVMNENYREGNPTTDYIELVSKGYNDWSIDPMLLAEAAHRQPSHTFVLTNLSKFEANDIAISLSQSGISPWQFSFNWWPTLLTPPGAAEFMFRCESDASYFKLKHLQ